MKKFKDSILGSVVILGLTCLLIVLASAFTNQVTAPMIKQAKLIAAEKARLAVLPAADSFVKVEQGLSENVAEAYQAANGAGYVFEVKEKGFGGAMVFMIGVNQSGTYEGVSIITHTETPGLGTKVADKEYLNQFIGISDPETIDNATSATVSSAALKRALKTASAEFSALSGVPIDGITDASSAGGAGETTVATEQSEEAK